ncbi:MAG: sugar kinase, partial [Clostridia bacterium]|nr:sugar kinase [Clostridia bacterium]
MPIKHPDVLVIGGGVVDIPLAPVGPEVFDAHSTPLERIAMNAGGDAVNESIVLAQLGRAPLLISKVGQDAAGDFILKTLKKAG